MPGVFPDYPAPVIRNTENGTELVTMRWGMPPPPRAGGGAGHKHPQHVIAALAHVAQARKSLLGPGQQLRRVRAGAEP